MTLRPFLSRLARRLALVVAMLLAAASLTACSADDRLVVHTATGEYAFNVEVVDTPDTRAKGLMFRQELAKDSGMLFDFKREEPVSFWMMNTYIPLDMVFIAANGDVKSVHANARPHDQTSVPSGFPVQFVLEIPGGRAAEIGLKAGDRIEHARIK